MQYEAPETTKAAVSLLAKAKGSAYVLAGGSDLLVRMKTGFIEPDLIVDIKRIKSMGEIKKTATGFSIGAAGTATGTGASRLPCCANAPRSTTPNRPPRRLATPRNHPCV